MTTARRQETVTVSAPTELADAGSAEAVAEQIFTAALGAFDVLNIYLGDRLGWYRTLAEAGAMSPGELAARSGTDARYARE